MEGYLEARLWNKIFEWTEHKVCVLMYCMYVSTVYVICMHNEFVCVCVYICACLFLCICVCYSWAYLLAVLRPRC